jgi:hypothetical protein
LEVKEEELPSTGGPKEVLGVAEDGDRGGVVILLEPSLASAREGVDEERSAGSPVGIATGEESAFLEGEAVGFRAHVAEAEFFGEWTDGERARGFDFAENFVLTASGGLCGSGRHGANLLARGRAPRGGVDLF